MVSAGWFGEAVPELGNQMAVYGGLAVFVVGILTYLRGNNLDTFVFLAFGVFFFVLGMHYLSGDPAAGEEAGYHAWYNILWALFGLMLWWVGRGSDSVRGWFLLTLGLTLLLHGLAYWISPVLIMVGGYVGLISGLLALYITYREVLDSLNSGGAPTSGMG